VSALPRRSSHSLLRGPSIGRAVP